MEMTEDMKTAFEQLKASALDASDVIIAQAMAKVAAKALFKTTEALMEEPRAMNELAISTIAALRAMGKTKEQLQEESDLVIDVATLTAVFLAVGASGSPLYEEIRKICLLHEMAEEMRAEENDKEEE